MNERHTKVTPARVPSHLCRSRLHCICDFVYDIASAFPVSMNLPSCSSSSSYDGQQQLVYVHNREQWPPELLANFLADCFVRNDFVSEDEEQQLLAEIYPHMKRMRWEDEHWDGQIRQYREREQLLDSWRPENQALIRRIWHTSFPDPLEPSKYVHVLDLHQDGFILPHLDKPRYCGRVISGLSLLSTSVMRLRHQCDPLGQLCVTDLLLTRRSLYRLRYLNWATRLDVADAAWAFDLFKRNMRAFYLNSQWGYDERAKHEELTAATSRYLLVRNDATSSAADCRPIAYSHFRFVEDEGRPVLYCYELQVEPDHQQKGIGSIIIDRLERLAKGTQMELLMATVLAFNGPSLAFFHKHGFRTDASCRFGHDGPDGRDYVILSKQPCCGPLRAAAEHAAAAAQNGAADHYGKEDDDDDKERKLSQNDESSSRGQQKRRHKKKK